MDGIDWVAVNGSPFPEYTSEWFYDDDKYIEEVMWYMRAVKAESFIEPFNPEKPYSLETNLEWLVKRHLNFLPDADIPGEVLKNGLTTARRFIGLKCSKKRTPKI